MNYNIRVSMLDSEEALTIRHQARLLDVSRSSFYYNFIINNDTEVANIIVEIYRASCKTPIMLNNLLFYTRNLVIL